MSTANILCPYTYHLRHSSNLQIFHHGSKPAMASYSGMHNGILTKSYVNFIYIPSGLLLVGCAITKPEWLPYAAALAVALGSWQYYDMRSASLLGNGLFRF